MAAKVVTFRSGLKTSIGDLLDDAAMKCAQTEEALVGLVIALADYREEGHALFPRVLICDDLDTVLRNLQGSSPIEIGTGDREPGTVRRALKKCAPLADRGWAIWIERDTHAFRFGVFREPSATALDLRQTLLETESVGPFRALLVAQFAPGVVELVAAGNESLRVHLSGEREDQLQSTGDEEQIVEWSAADIPDETSRLAYISFSNRILHDMLRKGHGALIAVAPSDVDDWIEAGEDAVLLDPPLDLASFVQTHFDDPTSAALSELLSYSELLAGMLNSDGITVLDSVGRIRAFNWFIKTNTDDLSPREQIGGARHRAYSALKSLVDSGRLRGAFIRSNDGAAQTYGKA